MDKNQKVQPWSFGLKKAVKVKLTKIGTPQAWKNSRSYKGTRRLLRKQETGSGVGNRGVSNGTHHEIFFNGKADKHIRASKDYLGLPVFNPEPRRHDVPTPTSRFQHKPWPKNKEAARP